jgi:hypothetical protein
MSPAPPTPPDLTAATWGDTDDESSFFKRPKTSSWSGRLTPVRRTQVGMMLKRTKLDKIEMGY